MLLKLWLFFRDYFFEFEENLTIHLKLKTFQIVFLNISPINPRLFFLFIFKVKVSNM